MSPCRRRGFSLLELMVVIGIICMLLAILLPSLGRARESARQAQCASNLHQLSLAFRMYVNSNGGFLPWEATNAVFRSDDWIYWEQSAGRNLQQSVIAPYMSQPVDPAYFQCPSDDVNNRVRTPYTGYHFSYVMNSCLSVGLPSTPAGGNYTLTRIRDSAAKLLLYEEDEATIDDGYGTPQQGAGINLLAIRHDQQRQLPDNVATGLTLNGDCRGNAAFCDGHVQYIRRDVLHTPQVYDPTQP